MSIVGAILGFATYVALLAAATLTLVRAGKRNRILWPVLIALGLRLAVMLATHFVSVAHSNGGFFFADDRRYHEVGARIAHEWSVGHFIDPTGTSYAGSLQVTFSVLVGFVYTLTGEHVLAVKLVNVVLGAAITVPAAMLARQFGETAKARASWLVAICPTLVWWSATELKEALVCFLLVAGLAVVPELPERRAILTFGALEIALALTRLTAAICVAVAIFVALGVEVIRRRRAMTSAGLAWLAGFVLLAVAIVVAAGHGDPQRPIKQYWDASSNMLHHYRGGSLAPAVADFVRTLVSPYPWVFDVASNGWYRALYPGMWFWYVMLPLACLGAWRFRARTGAQVLTIVTLLFVALNAILLGNSFRERSAVEPLVLVLAAAGFISWRYAARVGGLALGTVAIFASLQSHSVSIGVSIAGAGAVLVAISSLFPRLWSSGTSPTKASFEPPLKLER